jgi:hypothetical protein
VTDSTSTTLTLPASLSIRGIAAVHDTLQKSLAGHDNIVVEIPADAQADLSFIQLMEASRISAAAQGKTITLKSPVDAGVKETLLRGGFLTDMDQASRLFWLHGKDIQ